MAAQYGDSRAQQFESPSRTQQHAMPMEQRYADGRVENVALTPKGSLESGSRLHYGSSSQVHNSQSMPDVLPSGRDYPSARSERRVSHGRRRRQSSTRQTPSFVAKGLLNLDNLQVKKSKTQPEWAKWSSMFN